MKKQTEKWNNRVSSSPPKKTMEIDSKYFKGEMLLLPHQDDSSS
jgi:hypothetical protein